MRPPKKSPTFRAWISTLAILTAGPALGEDTSYLDMSLEELLEVSVYSASKFEQKTSEAPASVSIVTADEIRAYGHQSLGAILRSVRGMYVSYDRNYEYLGVRGFGRAGNYNNRFLLLVDGYRANDSMYENAAIGSDLFLDVDLIDRVEIVRGPGSSIYGSNALYGVINVITKRGRDYEGLQASGQVASQGSRGAHLAWGKRYESGVEVLVSGSEHRRDGHETIYFDEPEFQVPEKQFGVVQGSDGGSNRRVHGRMGWRDFELTAAYVERDKDVPTASFGAMINEPNSTRDVKLAVGLAWETDVDRLGALSTRLVYGRSAFDRIGYFDRVNEDLPPFARNQDESRAAWWGTEAQLERSAGRHRLLVGAEYRSDYRQDQTNFDVDPYEVYVDEKAGSSEWALFAQDEIRFGRHVVLNAGVRHDDYETFGSVTNPRAALIVSPRETAAIKLLYGRAFRAPSVYELRAGVDRIANPDLEPERITTYELSFEHRLRPTLQVVVTAYRNEIRDLSVLSHDEAADMLVFESTPGLKTRGIELEGEKVFASGTRIRASYAWQRTLELDADREPAASPHHLAKLNAMSPMISDALRLGLELQYVGRQRTAVTGEIDERDPTYVYPHAEGSVLANLTVLSRRIGPGLELAASVYNLLDATIEHPGSLEHDQNVLLQDGRTFRLQMTYLFSRSR